MIARAGIWVWKKSNRKKPENTGLFASKYVMRCCSLPSSPTLVESLVSQVLQYNMHSFYLVLTGVLSMIGKLIATSAFGGKVLVMYQIQQ